MTTAENSSSQNASAAKHESESIQWLLVVVLALLCFALGYTFLGPMPPKESSLANLQGLSQTLQPPEQPEGILLPDESLSPEQVVEAQLEALADYRENRSAIRQVFAFASPANRSVTGPIGRFENMILNDQYRPMVESDHWITGRAVSRDKLATVLVTMLDEQDRVSVYRFYLSEQTEVHPNCWMTDRVVCLFQGGFRSDEGLSTSSPYIDKI